MNLNLRLLNLFIGLCKGAFGLPRDLYELGYKEFGLEYPFTNAQNHRVVPDLIITSAVVSHSILFEWKRGPNTEADQLRNYSELTTEDLLQRALIPRGQCEAHDVAVIGLAEHRDRLVIGIQQPGYLFPVLIVTERGLETTLNRFTVAQTDTAFRPLTVDWATAPTSYVPLDGESEDWEYAERLLPYVFEQMGRGSSHIIADDFAIETIPLYRMADQHFKSQIRAKIEQVLDYAARHQFQAVLRRNRAIQARTHSPTWDVVENPLTSNPDKRTRAYRSLAKAMQETINHFRGIDQQQDIDYPEQEPPA